ncbi:uncharacterized protein LOC135818256 [Sycon ciliatum]|uniref:uncharacterized protein LOC135812730 n=1 Tax=Sycon ciliatum TaxID=27933 RepID=UPI0031F6CB13
MCNRNYHGDRVDDRVKRCEMQQSLVTSSKIDRDGGSPAVTLSTLLSSPAWSLWRSPSFVALVRAVFVGHRILRRTSVTLFARPARAEYGVPRPVDNTSPGLPRMGPHSQSWQWKKEGSFHCPGATLTRTANWCSRGVCRAANGASLIRRFDRRTREELMDDLSNVPLGSERRRVLTLGLGHSTAVPVWLPALPAFQPVAVSCHHSAATVFGTTVLMALMHSTAQARSHQLQVKPTARSCHHRHWAQ